MSRGRYAVGWVVVAVGAPAVAFAAVAVGRDAVGGSTVVDALSPAQVSAALSTAGGPTPSAPATSSDPGSTRPYPVGTHTATVRPHPSSSGLAGGASTPTQPAGSSQQPVPSTSGPNPSATPSSAPTTALLSSPGGSVVARCTGRTVYLVSWTPAQGFHVKGVQRGPAEEAEIEFESDHQSSSVTVHCQNGVPVQELSGGTDSGGGTGDD